MATILATGDKVTVHSSKNTAILSRLEAKRYELKQDQFGNLFLGDANDLAIPPRTYGNVTRRVERIWNTFQSRNVSTGVLLSGIKGSGKTMTAKMLSRMASDNGFPTIVINRNFCGIKIGEFLNLLDQEAVVLFDEFEKIFVQRNEEGSQTSLLTVFDGLLSSKMLFVVTCNDMNRISDYMLNRPGRLYYSYEFKTLEHDVIEEYCQDKVDRTHFNVPEVIAQIKSLAVICEGFSFDMLQALVEEMNRYRESVKECLSVLNIRFTGIDGDYKVSVSHPTRKISNIYPSSIREPIREEAIDIEVYASKVGKKKSDKDTESIDLVLTTDNLIKANHTMGEYIYKSGEFEIKFDRVYTRSVGFSDLLTDTVTDSVLAI